MSKPVTARSWGYLARAARVGIDLLFPPRCIQCGQTPRQTTSILCDLCLDRLQDERRQPACPRCASDVAKHEVARGRCATCRGRRPQVRATARVGAHARQLAGLLRHYKYGNRTNLGPLLGRWLAEAVAATPWFERVEAVAAVPTLRRRKLIRPHYPAEDLARIVASRLNRPVVPLLRRVRARRHQIGLSYDERLENVRGAFAMCRGVSLDNARLLLVDDVKTTGATLHECAKTLRRGGAAEVYAAVIVAAHSGRDFNLARPGI